ncbi:uncharacterized protein V6R79_017193 [Siganus canaliculatus]
MQPIIRRYRPSDGDTARMLFRICHDEQIRPCFQNAMTSPLYLAVTMVLCCAGFLLGSVLGAVVLPAAWVGLIYYSCYDVFNRFVENQLQTDMQDIPGNYLRRPDDCFWVAEVVVGGRAQVMATVAVVAKQSGKETYGELCRLMVSPLSRRMGLGVRMCQTALDFCKDRGFSKVVLETTSTQTAAVAMYRKMGFIHTLSHKQTVSPAWLVTLCRTKMHRMTKNLK